MIKGKTPKPPKATGSAAIAHTRPEAAAGSAPLSQGLGGFLGFKLGTHIGSALRRFGIGTQSELLRRASHGSCSTCRRGRGVIVL